MTVVWGVRYSNSELYGRVHCTSEKYDELCVEVNMYLQTKSLK
jgi:hypothetical protein